MEYREKIKKLINEGKINPDQAILLLNALKESENRRQKIFEQVLSQKNSRKKNIYGFLSSWFWIILCAANITIYIGTQRHLGKDTLKAVICFEEANIYLEEENYPEAVKYYKRGIKEAPKLSLGYSLLGAGYRLLYEKNRDEAIKMKAIEAFKKAHQLRGRFSRRWKMNTISLFFTFIFLMLILGVFSIIVLLLYNNLVKKEEKVNEAWAQAGVLCQRKLDLVPAIVEAVEGYAQHEKETYKEVVEARAEAQRTIEIAGGVALSGKETADEFLRSQENVGLGLVKLFALVEQYPDLKASTNFLTLQGELQETEDMITKARGIYNNNVRAYNAGIKYFPANLIAALFKFKPKEYFEAENKEVNNSGGGR